MRGLLLSLLCTLLLVSCQQEDSKTFSYAVSGEFRPFSYVDDEGKLAGLDVEVGKLVAKKLGKKPAPLKYKFAGMIEGLKSGRFDAAVASHTITPERQKHVHFSTPYYYSGPHVFSRTQAEQVELAGKEIAVSKGSTYQKTANNHTDNIKVYDSDIIALEALNKGRHQLVITDLITGTMAIKNGLSNIHPNQGLGQSRQGIAVNKDNQTLLKDINLALDKLRKEGELTRLSMKYFNRDITTQ